MNRIGLALLLVCVLHSQAGAQNSDDARYKTVVEEAVMEFGEGRYAEARALFSQAHALKPNARTLRGLGMTAFELRNYTVALKMLRQSQSSRINPLTAKQQDHVKGLIERSQAFVGTFDIIAPAGAQLKVDGIDVDLGETNVLMLDTGKHTVVAVFAGGGREERNVDVRGNEHGTLQFHGSADATVVAAKPGESKSEAAEQSADEQPWQDTASDDESILPLVLMGSGGLLVVGGLVVGALAWQAGSVLNDNCREGKLCHEDLQPVKDRAMTFRLASDVLWISGALLGGIGAYLYFSDDSDEIPSVSATLAVGHDGGGVLLQGAF